VIGVSRPSSYNRSAPICVRVLFSDGGGGGGEDADDGVEQLSRTASLDLRQRVVGKLELGGRGATLGPMQLKVRHLLTSVTL
jgi:hypothetical protein